MNMNPKLSHGADMVLEVISLYEKDGGFKKSLSDLKKGISESKKQVGEFVKATSDFEKAENSLNSKKSALTKKENSLKADRERLEAENLDLAVRIEDFEKEKSAALLDIDEKVSENEAENARLAQERRVLTGMRADIEKDEAQVGKMKAELRKKLDHVREIESALT